MEAELERFRQRKRAEEKKERIKENLKKSWGSFTSKLAAAVLPEQESSSSSEAEDQSEPCSSSDLRRKRNKKSTEIEASSTKTEDNVASKGQSRTLAVLLIILKFSMWVFLWIGFIKIGFGAVFFAISTLVFIWMNMNSGGGKRRRGQKSAYSVFNENCEAIDGSLNAELLEKHLLYRGVPTNSD